MSTTTHAVEDGDETFEDESEGELRPYFEGDALVAPVGVALPDFCIKCGVKGNISRRKTQFMWTPPSVRLLMAVGAFFRPMLLVGLLVMAFSSRRATLELPLCAACNTRWSRGINALIVGFVALLSAPLVAIKWGTKPDHIIWGLLVGFLLFFYFAIEIAPRRMLKVNKIDARGVVLKGFGPKAMRRLWRRFGS